MGDEVEGVVIKPPIERIYSGKVFRPSRRLVFKYWINLFLVALGLYIVVYLSAMGIAFLAITIDEQLPAAEFYAALPGMTLQFTVVYWLLMATWLIPGFIIAPKYVKSIEYSVISEAGEAMPEIYVKKGIINITRKHVPFRTITNIASRAGPVDRLLGIGNVEVETAGFSGTSQTGPEEKLEGIVFYEELRDFILQELRKFRVPYTASNEPTVGQREKDIGVTDDENITQILKEIRDLIKTLVNK